MRSASEGTYKKNGPTLAGPNLDSQYAHIEIKGQSQTSKSCSKAPLSDFEVGDTVPMKGTDDVLEIDDLSSAQTRAALSVRLIDLGPPCPTNKSAVGSSY